MARRFLERSLAAPLLLLNFVLHVFVLAIASWALNNIINGTEMEGGNAATPNFVLVSLLAVVVGMSSFFAALRLLRDATSWSPENVAAATSSALIAWSLLLLAFGLACKEIYFGNTGTTLKFMEIFVIALTATHGLYILVIHAGSLGL